MKLRQIRRRLSHRPTFSQRLRALGRDLWLHNVSPGTDISADPRFARHVGPFGSAAVIWRRG